MSEGCADISKLNSPSQKYKLSRTKDFAGLGKKVVFIAPSNSLGDHRPDILLDGLEWEIKCPVGKGKRTIEKLFNKTA